MPGEDHSSHEYVLRLVADRQVEFVRLWFTDILGMLKSTAIPVDEVEYVLREGLVFDGGAVEGFAREDESDMLAVPDPSTFAVLPSPHSGPAVARMFCDIHHADGRPAPTDPRQVLKKQLKAAHDQGYSFYVGPEIEYFYFRSAVVPRGGLPEPLDDGGYFDLTPLDAATPLRRQTMVALEQMNIGVESTHHEGAPSQHEMDLRYADALSMADNVMTFRLIVKGVACEHGFHATFMPKPLAACNGSGMHLNLSLFAGSVNVFHDSASDDELSATARYFLAGLLRHARELTLFTNQWVNSYKRLVPGFEAPSSIGWAPQRRPDLIRVPGGRHVHEQNRRIEYRLPDAACNPYLVFALLLAAGLRGIREELPLLPTQLAAPSSDTPDNQAAGREALPADLHEAIAAARGGTLAPEVLGDVLFNKLLAAKEMEWDKYRSQVHHWELDQYLAIL